MYPSNGSVKLRKIYDLNQKNFIKLSIEHNLKLQYINFFPLQLTETFKVLYMNKNSLILL
jgi:hypothetical protein